MPSPIFVAGAGALLKGLGGLFGKKAKRKREQEIEQGEFTAAKARHGQSEDARLALTQQILNAAQQRGVKGFDNLPPALMTRRAFTGAAPPKNSGSSTFGDILGGLGDIGLSYADYTRSEEAARKRKAELDRIHCILDPAMCGDEGVADLGPQTDRGSLGRY